MLTERRFFTGSININVAEGGAGPDLLLIHGASDSWRHFLPLLPALTQRWTAHAVDLRGHGRSDRSSTGYDRAGYAGDCVALARTLATPLAVIGHSLGGLLAIEVALALPNQISALVLEDPPLFPHTPGPGGERAPYARFAFVRELAASGQTVDEIADRLKKRNPHGNPDQQWQRAEEIALLDPEVLTSTAGGRGPVNRQVERQLAALACPVLLLRAGPQRGGVMTAADEQKAASLTVAMTVQALQGVGHDVARTAPQGYLDAVMPFLSEALRD